MPTKKVVKGSAGGIECVINNGEEVLKLIDDILGRDASKLVSRLGKVMICKGIFKEAYIISDTLTEVIKVIFSKGYIPYSAGLYIGRIRRSKPYFIPSINLLQLIYDELGLRRAIVVSDEGLKPFLYGNDILRKSIIRCYEPLKKNDVVGIVGTDGYVYGIGLCTIESCNDLRRLRDLDLVAKNVFDVGWYLRGGTETRERMFKI